jgi:hypothetical protein
MVDKRVPVTERALQQRVNRKLRDNEQVLQVTRGARAEEAGFGPYHLVDRRRNVIINKNVDLEEYGRELGVLTPYERMVEDA